MSVDRTTIRCESVPINVWAKEAKRAGALGDGRDPREANGAMLRALKRLLEEKDKTGAWGGLTRKLTKEGHYLWLCPTHAEEYPD